MGSPLVPRSAATPIGIGIRNVLLAAVLGAVVLAGCSEEEAVPIDPADPPVLGADIPDVTHSISPTPQMEDLARRQCLDDPTLAEGYVQAIDPDGDQVLSEITVDCAEVRSGG